MHIWEGGRKNKMSKNECELFYNQSFHLVDRGQNPLKLLYSINDSHHNIHALQGRANKATTCTKFWHIKFPTHDKIPHILQVSS